MLFRILSISRAPKYFDTTTPAPNDKPIKKLISKLIKGKLDPTAANACDDTNCPTMTLSTALYNCWKRFPKNRGIAKRIIFEAIGPSVILISCVRIGSNRSFYKYTRNIIALCVGECKKKRGRLPRCRRRAAGGRGAEGVRQVAERRGTQKNNPRP